MIAAGKLDRRVTLLKPESTQDALGAQIDTWSEAAWVWAALDSLNLREATRMAGEAVGTEIKLMIRHRTDVQIGWRAEFQDQTYAVVSLAEVGRREGLFLILRAA